MSHVHAAGAILGAGDTTVNKMWVLELFSDLTETFGVCPGLMNY